MGMNFNGMGLHPVEMGWEMGLKLMGMGWRWGNFVRMGWGWG